MAWLLTTGRYEVIGVEVEDVPRLPDAPNAALGGEVMGVLSGALPEKEHTAKPTPKQKRGKK